jgi:hypothetical protein
VLLLTAPYERVFCFRYRDAAPETMLLLNQRCMEVQSELTTAESKIKASADVNSLRKLAMEHAWSMASNMVSNLIGHRKLRELCHIRPVCFTEVCSFK